MVSVSFDLTRPRLPSDFIKKHASKDRFLLIRSPLVSFVQVLTGLADDQAAIAKRDVLLV